MDGRLNNSTMKKIFMILAVVQMMICSCMKPEIENTQIKTPAAGEVVFTAVIEQTKALPAAGGIVSWTENEEIGVYDGTSYVKATVLGVEGNSITFSAAVDPDAASYVAINPYEAGAAGDGQTINFAAVQAAGKHVVSIALFTDAEETVSFKNVGNLLRFKVNKAAVKKAKIVGNNAEKLAGNVSANAETGEATGTLTVAEIVTDITPGVDNFIALAPGVSLPDGFTITLYGDEDCTDYQGEVSSAAPLDFTGENARNQMRNLGLIDGWIDNYKLWQAGKPITIAGIEYTKESTGFDGALLSATEADVDLRSHIHEKSGVFFLEAANDCKFTTASVTTLGTASAEATVLLIGRYDNAPFRYEPTSYIEYAKGGLAIKNMYLIPNNPYYTFLGSKVDVGKFFHIDNCKFEFASGKYLINMPAGRYTVESLKVVNSNMKTLEAGGYNKTFSCIVTAANTYLDKIKEIIIENNIFYNENVCRLCMVSSSGKTPTSGNRQQTICRIANNTLYNLTLQTGVQSESLKSVEFTKNLCFRKSGVTTENGIIAYSSNTSEDNYSVNISDNITNYALTWFNPNVAGAFKEPKKYVTATSGDLFKVANLANAVFTPVDAYASYGAQR